MTRAVEPEVDPTKRGYEQQEKRPLAELHQPDEGEPRTGCPSPQSPSAQLVSDEGAVGFVHRVDA